MHVGPDRPLCTREQLFVISPPSSDCSEKNIYFFTLFELSVPNYRETVDHTHINKVIDQLEFKNEFRELVVLDLIQSSRSEIGYAGADKRLEISQFITKLRLKH